MCLQDYTGIDLSWQQRHLQMTPLFAATLASQPGQTLADTGTLGSVQLRATQQSLAFTPTQGTYVHTLTSMLAYMKTGLLTLYYVIITYSAALFCSRGYLIQLDDTFTSDSRLCDLWQCRLYPGLLPALCCAQAEAAQEVAQGCGGGLWDSTAQA